MLGSYRRRRRGSQSWLNWRRILPYFPEILWSLFFITLCFPVYLHLEESRSFWNGSFSFFQTVVWPGSFFFLSAALLCSGWRSLCRRNGSRSGSVPPALFWLWLAWLVWGIMSTWQHGFSLLSLQTLFLWGIMGITAVALARTEKMLQVLPALLLGLGLFQTVLALGQTLPSLWGSLDFAPGAPVLHALSGETLRGSGTFLHPNVLGFFLVFTFFLSAKLPPAWRPLRFFLLLGIIGTFSRSALLALLAGGVLEFFASLDNRRQARTELLIIIGACVLGFFLRFHLDTLSPSNVERIGQLPIALRLIAEQPLWGVGLRNFSLEMAQLGSFFPWQLQPVHNLVLLSAAEMGIFAGIMLAGIFAWSAVKLLRAKKAALHSKDPAERQELGMLSALFATLAVFALFDHLLLTSVPSLLLVAVFAAYFFRKFSD